MKKVIIIITILTNIFCLITKTSAEECLAKSQQWEPFTLEADYDFYGIRQWIFRPSFTRTERSISSSGQSSSREITVYPIPHFAGIRLGNGLFYDINGTLSFDILEILGINDKESFLIHVEKEPTQLKKRLYVKKDSSELTAVNTSLFDFKYSMNLNEPNMVLQCRTPKPLLFKKENDKLTFSYPTWAGKDYGSVFIKGNQALRINKKGKTNTIITLEDDMIFFNGICLYEGSFKKVHINNGKYGLRIDGEDLIFFKLNKKEEEKIIYTISFLSDELVAMSSSKSRKFTIPFTYDPEGITKYRDKFFIQVSE